MSDLRTFLAYSLTTLLGVACSAVIQAATPPSSGIDLTGKVTADGKPVSGAMVFVYTAHPKTGISSYCPSCYPDCSKKQQTKRDGTFKIPSLADWLKFRLLVVKSGYEPQFVPKVDPASGPVEVQLKPAVADLSHGVIGAHIVDEHNKSIVGATMEPGGETQSNGTMCGYAPNVQPVAISDENGDARFFPKESIAGLVITTTARDHSLDRRVLTPSDNKSLPTIVLLPGTTVTGILRSPTGTALSGVAMTLAGNEWSVPGCGYGVSDRIATDDNGRFTFSNVSQGTELRVSAQMESLGRQGLSASSADFMTSESGTTTEIDMSAEPAVEIDGQVVLSNGNPLPDKTPINLGRESTRDALFYSMASDGRFHFQGVPLTENVQLRIEVKGYILHPNAFAKSDVYLLRAALARGERHFSIVLDPVDAVSNREGVASNRDVSLR